jgi:hypothetical protein
VYTSGKTSDLTCCVRPRKMDNGVDGRAVEGLYCKRPIQCLTSSEIFTPNLWGGVRTHSLVGEGVGVNSSEDARHCSVLYLCKYFVPQAYLRSLNLSSQILHRFHKEIKTLAHTCNSKLPLQQNLAGYIHKGKITNDSIAL